jgi:hypothetical protein
VEGNLGNDMMRTDRAERLRAEQVSAAVDRLVCDPEADVALPHSEAAEALAAARQMARLPALLGPVDPAFEERVMRQVRRAGPSPRRTPWLRLGWAVGGLALVLLAVLLLTPLGDTAVAGLMAVFDLGSTDLRVAPEQLSPAVPDTAVEGGRAVRQSLTLDEAQGLVAFTIPQPGYLPPGFRLSAVYGYRYPDLPAWMPQPFFVELIYNDSAGEELLLRVYSIALGDEASVSSLNLRAPPIEDAQDVEVNGQPGVLLRQDLEPSGIELLELVWEQDDLILALSSHHLDKLDLLEIARSIQGSNR